MMRLMLILIVAAVLVLAGVASARPDADDGGNSPLAPATWTAFEGSAGGGAGAIELAAGSLVLFSVAALLTGLWRRPARKAQ